MQSEVLELQLSFLCCLHDTLDSWQPCEIVKSLSRLQVLRDMHQSLIRMNAGHRRRESLLRLPIDFWVQMMFLLNSLALQSRRLNLFLGFTYFSEVCDCVKVVRVYLLSFQVEQLLLKWNLDLHVRFYFDCWKVHKLSLIALCGVG